jgi:hypothetical protein
MPAQVLTGVGPTTLLTIPIQAGQSGIDMTTVTAVSLNVKRGRNDPSPGVWSAVILSSLPPTAPGGSSMVAYHAFQVSDCTVPGRYIVQPVLTLPGGTVDCYPRELIVTDRFTP